MIHVWPYLVMFGVVAGLWLMMHRGKTRSPIPVITTAQLPTQESAEIVQLAELVRSGAFYVCGAVLDWRLCMEFAAKAVNQVNQSTTAH